MQRIEREKVMQAAKMKRVRMELSTQCMISESTDMCPLLCFFINTGQVFAHIIREVDSHSRVLAAIYKLIEIDLRLVVRARPLFAEVLRSSLPHFIVS